jgi:hypothetical protein
MILQNMSDVKECRNKCDPEAPEGTNTLAMVDQPAQPICQKDACREDITTEAQECCENECHEKHGIGHSGSREAVPIPEKVGILTRRRRCTLERVRCEILCRIWYENGGIDYGKEEQEWSIPTENGIAERDEYKRLCVVQEHPRDADSLVECIARLMLPEEELDPLHQRYKREKEAKENIHLCAGCDKEATEKETAHKCGETQRCRKAHSLLNTTRDTGRVYVSMDESLMILVLATGSAPLTGQADQVRAALQSGAGELANLAHGTSTGADRATEKTENIDTTAAGGAVVTGHSF